MHTPTADSLAPDSRPRFRDLVRRVLDGSDEAVRQLQDQYGEHIMRAVRRKLPRQLRGQFDSVDFVQDVWASFFRTPERNFDNAEHLVAFLVRMAQNKVADAARAGLEAQKRNAAREQPLPEFDTGHDESAFYARVDTPSQAAIGEELWALLLAGQPAEHREVLTLLRDGVSQTEVAARLQMNRKTVQRILHHALERTRS